MRISTRQEENLQAPLAALFTNENSFRLVLEAGADIAQGRYNKLEDVKDSKTDSQAKVQLLLKFKYGTKMAYSEWHHAGEYS